MKDYSSVVLEMRGHLSPELDERSVGDILDERAILVDGNIRCKVAKLDSRHRKRDYGGRISRSDGGYDISVNF
jgi:hypothetical protein